MLLAIKMLEKRTALPLTNASKLKKVNLSTLRNKRQAIVPKNKAKRADSTNVLYYIKKLKKLIKYQQATKE